MRPSLAAIVVGIACLGSPVLGADLRVRDAERLAAHGELGAARAQYQTIFDELVSSGAEATPALHYNLGTLALSDDDLGMAVLHLLAAARRAPTDDDIRHNLDVALSRRADQVTSGRLEPGARLPAGPVRLALGVALGLLGLLLALSGTGSPGVASMARRLLGPIVVVVVVSAALFALRWQADRTDVAVVMVETEALPQPDRTAKGFTVHPGLTGVVVAEQLGFLRLRLENGVDVWIGRDRVGLVP